MSDRARRAPPERAGAAPRRTSTPRRSRRRCCSARDRGCSSTAWSWSLILVALYLVLPELAGLEDSLRKIEDADPVWIAIALGFNLLSFAAYIALFRGILGGAGASPQVRERLDWRTSYQITLAGLAATRLFSAGGAGGIALTYWALRRAGMEARQAASRMVAFLVLLYTVYLLALVICGIFLRIGLFPGPGPGEHDDRARGPGRRRARDPLPDRPDPGGLRAHRGALGAGPPARAARASTSPASRQRSRPARARRCPSCGTPAAACLRSPARSGFWAANIAVLWACFHAFGEDVPTFVLVQGFFVGMTANLLPFFPGGVGSVDAGMIAAFLAFGEPSSTVFVVGAGLPRDRLLAADPAGDPRLPSAAPHRRAVARGGGTGQPAPAPAVAPRGRWGKLARPAGRSRGYTLKSEVTGRERGAERGLDTTATATAQATTRSSSSAPGPAGQTAALYAGRSRDPHPGARAGHPRRPALEHRRGRGLSGLRAHHGTGPGRQDPEARARSSAPRSRPARSSSISADGDDRVVRTADGERVPRPGGDRHGRRRGAQARRARARTSWRARASPTARSATAPSSRARTSRSWAAATPRSRRARS